MKRIIASAAVIVMMAGTAGPAFAKAHAQPADAANFAQGPDRGNVTDDTGVTDQVTKVFDARGFTDGEMGVDGKESSQETRNRDNPVFDPPPSPQE